MSIQSKRTGEYQDITMTSENNHHIYDGSKNNDFNKRTSNSFDLKQKDFSFFQHSLLNETPSTKMSSSGIVKGYIKEINTNQAISNAQVFLIDNTIYKEFTVNSVYTDDKGYYELEVNYERSYVYIRANTYFTQTSIISFNHNDPYVWNNVSLKPNRPAEESQITIELYDEETQQCIDHALVFKMWFDDQDHYDINYTHSKPDCTYQFYSNSGSIGFAIFAKDYLYHFTDSFTISEKEDKTIVIYLKPIPPQNCTLFGTILDNETKHPVENATVNILWKIDPGYYDYYQNFTYSDSTGYYSINVPAGSVQIGVSKEGYFGERNYSFITLNDGEMRNIDFFLQRLPEENSLIKGYVKNNRNGIGIEKATIHTSWYDSNDHYLFNSTQTDSDGYYEIQVAKGSISVYVSASHFFSSDDIDVTIDEEETVNIDFFLDPFPEENSKIFGYVKNEDNNELIAGASLYLSWEGDDGKHYYSNFTVSDTNGYYSFNVASGIIELNVEKQGYFSEYIRDLSVTEHEEIELDFLLSPYPSETVIVQGYVTDAITDEPVIDTCVSVYWKDNLGHYDSNQTLTGENGYYEMNTAPGIIEMYVTKEGYFYDYTDEIVVIDSDLIERDFLLEPFPSETALISGYVQDNDTNEPIADASISLVWQHKYNRHYYNSTETNSQGYFEFNVAAGEIDLYVNAEGYFKNNYNDIELSEFETRTFDFYLTPRPIESSIIEGYIYDEQTGRPLSDVRIFSYWRDSGNYDFNFTFSDENGYYRIHVAPGNVSFNVEKQGYIENDTEYWIIDEHNIYQKNISLFNIPDETAEITGFVTIVDSNEPLFDARIYVSWTDSKGHSYSKYTYTDKNGFYEVAIASGLVDIRISKAGFDHTSLYDQRLFENDLCWFNTSLDFSPFHFEILQPESGIYYQDNKIIPLMFRTIIFGDVHISAEASSRATKMEFYIDGKLKKTDSSYPYSYFWNDRSILRHKHIIKIIVYDERGNTEVTRKMVTRYF